MLPVSALKSMCVMIATPCYGNAAQVNFTQSVVRLMAECVKFGLPVRFDTLADSLITSARNTMVARFLSDPIPTHLFFIDSDCGFEPEAFFRLLLADRDVVAGACPSKEYRWPEGGLPAGMTKLEFEAQYMPFAFNPLADGSVPVDRDNIGEVSEIGAAFLCIKRQVFHRLMDAYPNLDYKPSAPRPGELPGTHWLFFDTMRLAESKRYLSEDIAFCRLWRQLGGTVYVDVLSKLSHQGPHIWHGDFKAHLDARRRPS